MDVTLDGLLARLEAQQELIERLEARLDQVEHDDATAAGRPDAGDLDGPEDPERTDRRQLLTRAAAVAAGAAAGGAALVLGQATPAAAASGTFDGNPAVSANANPAIGYGVFATTTSGQAVRGESTGTGGGIRGVNNGTGYGVMGSSTNGTGVDGSSNTGAALQGYPTQGLGVRATGGASAVEALAFVNAVHLQLSNNDNLTPPPSNAVARSKGGVLFDSNEDLWLCIQSGTPGVWRRISGANTAGALTVKATPTRVYDSRAGYPPAVGTKSPLAPNVARTCDLKANSSGVPAGATAVLVSLVATNTTGGSGGFLSIYRNGVAWPGTSNLNWSGPGQNVAVTTVTAVDGNAICNLYSSQTTDVVVDVLGYYR